MTSTLKVVVGSTPLAQLVTDQIRRHRSATQQEGSCVLLEASLKRLLPFFSFFLIVCCHRGDGDRDGLGRGQGQGRDGQRVMGTGLASLKRCIPLSFEIQTQNLHATAEDGCGFKSPCQSKILMGLNLMIMKTMFQRHLSGSVGMSRNHKEVHLTDFKLHTRTFEGGTLPARQGPITPKH